MYDLNESRKKIIAVLGKEQKEKYFQLVKSWVLFKKPPFKIHFDLAVREIIRTEVQLKAHNQFMLAIMERESSRPLANKPTTLPTATEKDTFDYCNITDYIDSPAGQQPPPNTDRTAASEFFFPDIGFIAARIELHAWENGLEGAEKNVAEHVAHLCQSFIKNILTAMISKMESYRIKDSHFQYGFGLPTPDPLLRNTHKIFDRSQESKVVLAEEEDSFAPICTPSIEMAEQEAAFAYACGSRPHRSGKLTVQLLYSTLRENPHIIGLHSINSTNLLKLGMQLDES